MPETPDFEAIARRLTFDEDQVLGVVEQLRLIWNAGLEAGGQHETFVKHLKDENTAAHLALDQLNAPTTKHVPTWDGAGKQDVTVGLAERIDAARRQIWNARGAADIAKLEGIYDGPSVKTLLRSLDR